MILLQRFTMTPYRTRVVFRLFTGFVILTVAYALAGLTWRIAGHAGTGAVTVPSTQRPVPIPDIAPALALAPFGRSVASEAAQPTALAVELKGVIFAQPATLASAFITVNGEAARPFKVGDALLSATVETIQVNRVLLRNGGRVESLTFKDAFAAALAPAATTNTGSAAPAPSPAPPGASAAPSTTDLIARFDARPVAGGFQVGGNAPPGMRAGDVVQSVNGTTLTSPDAARDAFARAQTAGTAQLQILRDGKNLTLTVPIR